MKEDVNLFIDGGLINGGYYLLKHFGGSERLKNFISFSEPQDLIGENINKFFPEKSDGIDLVITHADYETVEIKTVAAWLKKNDSPSLTNFIKIIEQFSVTWGYAK